MEVLTTESLEILTFVLGPIATNCYVVICKATKEAVIVDAGLGAEKLVKAIEDRGATLKAVWQTHAHIDHVAGLNEVRAMSEAPILLHEAEQPLYDAAVQQGMRFGFQISPLPTVDQYVDEGEVVNVGDQSAKILVLPGHSPGHVVFVFEEDQIFLGGDVLFAGSIGRVDLPGSDPAAMRASLARIKGLSPELVVLPGHGPKTTIGQELKLNPFLRG